MQFNEYLTVSQFFPAVFCAGILFLGLLLYIMMYFNSRERLHLAMVVMGGAGFVFVLGEALILASGWMLDAKLGMQFHRMEQVSATVLLFAMPFMSQHLLQMTPGWKKFNRIICIITLVITVVMVIAAFVAPDLFISVTIHRKDYLLRQADYGRGHEGILYMARDGLLALMILYMLAGFLIDMIMHRRLRYLLLAFTGLLIAVTGAAFDITSVYTGRFYDLTPDLRYRVLFVGLVHFLFFFDGRGLRSFLNQYRIRRHLGMEPCSSGGDSPAE
jgi:hypothetical protein